LVFTLKYGYVFIDAENWIPANALVTPNHIQPEWYFLFAYAILRSIPNKLGGVVGLLLAVLILFGFSFGGKSLCFSGFIYSPISRFIFWSFVNRFFLLTWLGMCPAEEPYVGVALLITLIYFTLGFMLMIIPRLTSFMYLN
jgi:ubiquinol-cytochrome c reductase cytochrome b subunit